MSFLVTPNAVLSPTNSTVAHAGGEVTTTTQATCPHKAGNAAIALSLGTHSAALNPYCRDL